MIKKITLYRITRILLIITLIVSIISSMAYSVNEDVYELYPPGTSGINAVIFKYIAFALAGVVIAITIVGQFIASDDSMDKELNISLFTFTMLGAILTFVVITIRFYLGSILGPFNGDGPFPPDDVQGPGHSLNQSRFILNVALIGSLLSLYVIPIGILIYIKLQIKKARGVVKGKLGSAGDKASNADVEAPIVKTRVHDEVWKNLVSFFVLRTVVPMVLMIGASILLEMIIQDLNDLIDYPDEYADDYTAYFMMYFFMLYGVVMATVLCFLSSPYIAFKLYIANKERNPLSQATIIIFQVVSWYGVIQAFILYQGYNGTITPPTGITRFIEILGYIIGLVFFIVQLITFVKMNTLENSRSHTINKVSPSGDVKIKRASGGIA